ncbi:hypothetical protein K4F52_010386, partial [Lecanicillium sp. MT-2017a]
MQDYAQQILGACRAKGKHVTTHNTDAQSRALTSQTGTWLATLRSAISHTSSDVISGPEWLDAIRSAMCALRIDWVPGSHSGRITSKTILQL